MRLSTSDVYDHTVAGTVTTTEESTTQRIQTDTPEIEPEGTGTTITGMYIIVPVCVLFPIVYCIVII